MTVCSLFSQQKKTTARNLSSIATLNQPSQHPLTKMPYHRFSPSLQIGFLPWFSPSVNVASQFRLTVMFDLLCPS
jgi:hypothetical protein